MVNWKFVSSWFFFRFSSRHWKVVFLNFYCTLILIFLLRYSSILSESTTKIDWFIILSINLLVDLKRAICSKGQLAVCRLGGVGRSNRGSPIDKGYLGVVNYQPLIFDVWEWFFLGRQRCDMYYFHVFPWYTDALCTNISKHCQCNVSAYLSKILWTCIYIYL